MNNVWLFWGAMALLALCIAAGVWVARNRPAFLRYVEESLYGVTWQWRWSGKRIVGLWCYCPTCKGELSFDDENCKTTKNLNERTTFFICKGCGGEEKGRVVGGDRRYVMTLVQHELMRRASSAEFLATLNPKGDA